MLDDGRRLLTIGLAKSFHLKVKLPVPQLRRDHRKENLKTTRLAQLDLSPNNPTETHRSIQWRRQAQTSRQPS